MSVHALAEMTEREWSDQLIGTPGKPGLARTLGWTTCYHTLRSKGSTSGFPDWVLVRERVIFIELKREDGRLTPAQRDWLDALEAAGAEVYVWRPSDLEAAAKVLTRRDKRQTDELRDLLEDWARLGKAKEEGGLAIWPHLLRLRDRTEVLLALEDQGKGS